MTPIDRADRRQRLAQAPDRHRERKPVLAEEEQADRPRSAREIGGSTSVNVRYHISSCSSTGMLRNSLDVAVADAAHQRVVRKAADAQHGAEQRRQHDADDGHAQRVERCRRRRPASTGRARRRCRTVSPMSKPAGWREEAEAALDAARLHVGQRVVARYQMPNADRATAPASGRSGRERPGCARTSRAAWAAVVRPLRSCGKGACSHAGIVASSRVVGESRRARASTAHAERAACGTCRRDDCTPAINAPAVRTSGRPWSTGRCSHAAGSARSSGRRCARRSRRSCRPP